MTESIRLYFRAFLNSPAEEGEARLSFFELLGISWALHLIYAFYSVLALYLGVVSYEYFSNSRDFSHLVYDALSFQFQKISLLSSLFGAILYPFIFHFGYKFWKAIFKFYAQLFDSEIDNIEEKSEDILSIAFSSNLFLILPIVGNVLSNLAHGFFIFRGLRQKYEFTSLQAFLVLMTPLFCLFLVAVFSASYFLFLLTLL